MTLSEDKDFYKNFLISCGAHVALALFAFAGGQVISKVFKNNDIEIIRSSVRVDVVGMPKFTVQELKKMEAEPVMPAEPEVAKGVNNETKVDEAEDVIKKDDLVIQEAAKVKKKNSFMNILSDYSNKKVSPKEQKKGKATGASNKNLDALIVEGNRLSQGSALVGGYSDEANSEFGSYVQTIPGAIRAHWRLPSYLLDKDLRCRIKIFLSVNGALLKSEIVESSGVPEFDERAIAALKATTFPKPSDAVGTRLTNSGIILGFPL